MSSRSKPGAQVLTANTSPLLAKTTIGALLDFRDTDGTLIAGEAQQDGLNTEHLPYALHSRGNAITALLLGDHIMRVTAQSANTFREWYQTEKQRRNQITEQPERRTSARLQDKLLFSHIEQVHGKFQFGNAPAQQSLLQDTDYRTDTGIPMPDYRKPAKQLIDNYDAIQGVQVLQQDAAHVCNSIYEFFGPLATETTVSFEEDPHTSVRVVVVDNDLPDSESRTHTVTVQTDKTAIVSTDPRVLTKTRARAQYARQQALSPVRKQLFQSPPRPGTDPTEEETVTEDELDSIHGLLQLQCNYYEENKIAIVTEDRQPEPSTPTRTAGSQEIPHSAYGLLELHELLFVAEYNDESAEIAESARDLGDALQSSKQDDANTAVDVLTQLSKLQDVCELPSMQTLGNKIDQLWTSPLERQRTPLAPRETPDDDDNIFQLYAAISNGAYDMESAEDVAHKRNKHLNQSPLFRAVQDDTKEQEIATVTPRLVPPAKSESEPETESDDRRARRARRMRSDPDTDESTALPTATQDDTASRGSAASAVKKVATKVEQTAVETFQIVGDKANIITYTHIVTNNDLQQFCATLIDVCKTLNPLCIPQEPVQTSADKINVQMAKQINHALKTNGPIMTAYRQLNHTLFDADSTWKHLEDHPTELALILGGNYGDQFIETVRSIASEIFEHGQLWYQSMRAALQIHCNAANDAHELATEKQLPENQTSRIAAYKQTMQAFLQIPDYGDFYRALQDQQVDQHMTDAWQSASRWAYEVDIFELDTTLLKDSPVFTKYTTFVTQQLTQPHLLAYEATDLTGNPTLQQINTLRQETQAFQTHSTNVLANLIETARAQEALRAAQSYALRGVLEGLRRSGFVNRGGGATPVFVGKQ